MIGVESDRFDPVPFNAWITSQVIYRVYLIIINWFIFDAVELD